MFGGTPSNLAISVMEAGRVEVIAGMNLPMLIKLSSVRKGDDMAVALEDAQAAGRKYINVASQLLSGEMSARCTRICSRRRIARDFLIVNQRGLHARASAKFVQLAERLRRLDHGREGRHHGRRHVDHGPDDAGREPRLLRSASPPPAPRPTTAIDALEALIADRFGEEA